MIAAMGQDLVNGDAQRVEPPRSPPVTAQGALYSIKITVQNEDQVPSGSHGTPGGVIQEQPKGPQHFSGPGISVPGRSNPGTSPDPILPWTGQTSSSRVVPPRSRPRVASRRRHSVASRSEAGPSTRQVIQDSLPALPQRAQCRISIRTHWRSALSRSFRCRRSRFRPTRIPDE